MFQIRLKCVQYVISVCQHADRSVSAALIHAVAALILEYVAQCAISDDHRPKDELELGIVVEGMKLAEVLVTLAEQQTSKWLQSICSRLKISRFLLTLTYKS